MSNTNSSRAARQGSRQVFIAAALVLVAVGAVALMEWESGDKTAGQGEGSKTPELKPLIVSRDAPLVFQPRFNWQGRPAGTAGVGFLAWTPEGARVGVTSAEIFDGGGAALRSVEWLSVSGGRTIAVFEQSLGPLAEGAVQGVVLEASHADVGAYTLTLDPRVAPEKGERVWVPDIDASAIQDYVAVNGKVVSFEVGTFTVSLERALAAKDSRGAPVLSHRTGRVVGILAGQPDSDKAQSVSIVPVQALIAASSKPGLRLEDEVGTKHARPGGQVDSAFVDARAGSDAGLLKRAPAPGGTAFPKVPKGAERIRFDSGGLSLSAWLSRPPTESDTTSPAVIFLDDGFSLDASSAQVVELLSSGGFVAMAPALRGANGNPGDFEFLYGEVDDVIAAGRHLAGLPGVDPQQILVLGHGVGGTLATLAAMAPSPFAAAASIESTMSAADLVEAHGELAPFDKTNAQALKLRSPSEFPESLGIPLVVVHHPASKGAEARWAFIKAARGFGRPIFEDDLKGEPGPLTLFQGVGRVATAFLRLTSQAGCERGEAEVCLALVGILALAEEYAEAADVEERLCESGSMEACNLLSIQLVKGQGRPVNVKKARAILEKSCQRAHSGACHDLAVLYARGSIEGGGERRAFGLFSKACELGEARACGIAGYRLVVGLGTAKDPSRGLRLMERGCEKEAGNACHVLGEVYAEGRHVKQDPRRAATLYLKACELEQAEACNSLVALMKDHASDKLSPAFIESFLQRVALLLAQQCHQQRVGASCRSLADMVGEGRGVPQNPDMARELYKLACEYDARLCR